MKALVKSKPEPGLALLERPKPSIGHFEVLVKIKKTAICGTDKHIYNWDEAAQAIIKPPLIAGHEFVGEIVEVGADVTHLKVGQRVSGEGHVCCGHCRNCRAGFQHLCRNTVSIGVSRDGAFADYLAIPATNICVLPDEISDDVAAVLDPLGNAVHTALSFDLVGEDVLITGAGPVGIMAAAIVKHVGARHVVITDVNDYRLQLAASFLDVLTVNPNKTTLHNAMQQLGMKEGFDVGLEVSGSTQALNQMLDTMNYGGKIALLGFLPKQTQIDWNHIIIKGLVLKGIYGREMYETWYKMINLLQSGMDIKPVITHHFAIADYEQAFATINKGQSGKIILDWH